MTTLARSLHAALGGRWSVQPLQASAFCTTWRAEGDTRLFVKTLPPAQADVLDAEADGLVALAATRTVRVPAVVRRFNDRDAGVAVLALEWLALHPPDAGCGTRLGKALGALHRADAGSRYGWHRDNRLGATPQLNGWRDGWIIFFAEQRLGAMRDRLAAQARDATLCTAVDAVIAALPRHFADGHRPRPSLIHGDLWSGNWGMLADGTPVIYDPAVSCSDAEAELAMMELFGSLPVGFREAYAGVAGLHPGYAGRRALYQLYHLLNHALLFGGGYAQQAMAVARTLAVDR
jgi:fructosamine-3-kinase